MLTGFQVRAARAGMNIKLNDLSKMTGVSSATLKRLEKVGTFEFIHSKPSTIVKILEFYNSCGVDFTETNGLVVKKPHHG